jgi:YfiH family protein
VNSVADQRIKANWPAPGNICAFTTTRSGGSSQAPFNSFNLAQHVGDEPAAVTQNRQQLMAASEGLVELQWLQQVHGTAVVEAGKAVLPEADACLSAQPGVGCAVMTADCLPVLFCNQAGTEVAAAHAGWRGLCEGVIDTTVQAMSSRPEQLMAWLGPAISQPHFEVGSEVRKQFMAAHGDAAQAFIPSSKPDHYLADLYLLARQCLSRLGVTQVYGGDCCSYGQSDRFYSYRRDGETGRMASVIYLK